MLCDHRLGIEGLVPESEPLVKGDAIDFTVDKSAEPGDLLGSLAELLIGLAEEKNESDDQV